MAARRTKRKPPRIKTLMQKRAVENMVEQVRKKQRPSVSRAMRDAGYSPNTATDPGKLTRSPSFRELCDEVGLTDNFILEALHDDIKNKPRKRVEELKLGAKIKGMFEEDNKQQNANVEALKSMADTLAQILKKND